MANDNKLNIDNSNYTITTVAMTVVFGLKGLDKEIFGIIHGFSSDNESVFRGSLSYLTYVTGYDKTSVIRSLKKLVEKGYVEKDESYNYGVKYVTYKSNYNKIMAEQNANGGGKIQPVVKYDNVVQNTTDELQNANSSCKMQPNNIDTNIDKNNYTITNVNNKEKNTKKEKSHKPTDEQTQMFEQARKYYPGNKGGLKAELDNFVKKYPDEWQKALPLLLPAMMREKVDKEQTLKNNNFKQNWKHFTTWINKRCWEEEYPNVTQAEINLLGLNVTTSESGEQKVEVKQDRSSFPMYQSLHGNPECYPEGTESRCGNWIIKDKKCVRTHRY